MAVRPVLDKTIRELVFHTGALPFVNDILLDKQGMCAVAREDFLHVVSNYTEDAEPGVLPLEFSNGNTILLESVVTHVTGSCSAFIKSRILTPLGLRSTFVDIEDLLADSRAGQVLGGDHFLAQETCAPAMGYVTTLADLSTLLQDMLRMASDHSLARIVPSHAPHHLDMFQRLMSLQDNEYGLFGQIFRMGSNLGYTSHNTRFSTAAEHDPVNIIPFDVHKRTGNVSGFDCSVTFIPHESSTVFTDAVPVGLINMWQPFWRPPSCSSCSPTRVGPTSLVSNVIMLVTNDSGGARRP